MSTPPIPTMLSAPSELVKHVFMPKEKVPKKASLSIVRHLYHHSSQDGTKGFTNRCTRKIESDEQVYHRWCMATGQWSPIVGKECWNEEPSLLMVQYGPSSAKKKQAEQGGSVLEIGIGVGDCGTVLKIATVVAKDSFDISNPSCPGLLMIRSTGIPIRYGVVVFPK